MIPRGQTISGGTVIMIIMVKMVDNPHIAHSIMTSCDDASVMKWEGNNNLMLNGYSDGQQNGHQVE